MARPDDLRYFVLLLGLFAASFYIACAPTDGPGDGDADADSDSDSDSDSDFSQPDAPDYRPCPESGDCEDGLLCNGVEVCQHEFGCVVEEDPIECDDGIDCTADSCLEPSGDCEFMPRDEECDDSDDCTLNICGATGCEHPIVDDGAECDDGRCYGGDCCRGCWDGESCRDGDSVEHCGADGDICAGCDDAEVCTADSCVDGACVHEAAPEETTCDDGMCCAGVCCAGCCEPETGTCADGTEPFLCGVEGEICGACPCPSDTCDEGSCPPGELGIVQVATGLHHTCARSVLGRVFCSGSNENGAIGNGAIGGIVNAPIRVGTAEDWAFVAAGLNHSCGVRDTDVGRQAFCWGGNFYSQLGTGSGSVDSPTPVEVGGGRNDWAEIAAGDYFSCGRTLGGLLFCWGHGASGQLGSCVDHENATTPRQVSPSTPITTGWAQVTTGAHHACGIRRDGEERHLYCWGNHHQGQLGIGPTPASYNCPQRVGTDTDWEMVAAGQQHTCAIKTDGSLYCWGDAQHGRLGQGVVEDTYVHAPTRVGSDSDWLQVAAGMEHSCAVKTDATIYCWGRNLNSELGLGDREVRDTPQHVDVEDDWLSIDAGGLHSCAVRADTRLWCWGHNAFGQLGLGHATGVDIPRFICFE